jgi:hypothetical protein
MSRRDPTAYGLALVGFAGAYLRGWIIYIVPGYTTWVWWQQGVLRLGCIGVSALVAWWIITWRLSYQQQAEPGAYWAMWSFGVIAGLIVEEVHAYVDSMFS